MNKKIAFHPSGEAAEPNGSDRCARAAFWVRMIGFVQVAAFCFFGLPIVLIRLIPTDQLRSMTDSQQFKQIIESQPFLGTMAWMFFLLGFLPGLVYLALGFVVRRGRGLAIDVALFLAVTQCIVFGLLLLRNMAAAFVHASPVSLTVNVLTVGSLLALLIHGVRCLWSVRSSIGMALKS